MINVSNLTLCRGPNVIIDALDLNVDQGSALIIRGANGSGKTTLLRGLAGLLPPHGGQITINGHILDEDRIAVMQSMIYIGHRDGLSGHLTATENLLLWAASRGANKASIRKVIPNALDELEIAALSDTPLYLMSEGQRKRCGLARLSLDLLADAPCRAWILDEPTTALDRTTSTQLAKLIDRKTKQGGAVVLSTHQEITLQSAQSLVLHTEGSVS